MWKSTLLIVVVGLALCGCSAERSVPPLDLGEAEQAILATNDAQIRAMVAGESTADFLTPEWSGVNLNGTRMSASGFEGEDRTMEYERIEVIDREVRLYGTTAALRWHAEFFVKVNGSPSFARMRLLDVYVHRDGRWLNDLTQVTPIHGTVGARPESP